MTQAPFRLLIADRFHPEALSWLKSHSQLDVRQATQAHPRPEEWAWAQGLIARSRTAITTETLQMAPDLKFLITTTSGFDHIDLVATQARNVIAMYTPTAHIASAAELTWALVLASARRLTETHKAVKAGDWARERWIGTELEGRHYGILGLGRIGQRVAQLAQAFGMSVSAYDPYADDEIFQKNRTPRLGLEEIFRTCDVISAHVPATPETHHMVQLHHFESLPADAIFVNTSRGTVVSELVLIEALEQQYLGALGLDVFEREPLARDSGLLRFHNVTLSPHLGATTHAAFRKAGFDAAHKALAFIERNEISEPLPPTALWYEASCVRPCQ